MNIGILGAGNVGGTLGRLWAAQGHHVLFGVRNPQGDNMQRLITSIGPNAQAGTLPDAVAFGEVVLLAIRWPGPEEFLPETGGWAGKILIDATNRIGSPLPGPGASAAEDVAQLAPGARVVKAFNTVGAEQFARPDFDGEAATMLLCGDDEEAKLIVGDLAANLGFEPMDAGPLGAAGLLEALGALWVHLATSGGYGRDIAFRLLRR